MNALLEELYQNIIVEENVQGIIFIDKEEMKNSEIDYFDFALLIVTKNGENKINHYELMNLKAELHFVNEEAFHTIAYNDDKILNWFIYGKTIFSRGLFIETTVNRLNQAKEKQKQLKITKEFCKVIRYYYDAKKFSHINKLVDAYQSIHQTLVHLGNLSMIEQGLQTSNPTWSEIKMFEPELYKLYHELIFGEEVLKKRVELLLLGINFLIVSKTKVGTSHLLLIMEQKKRWSFEELLIIEEIQHYAQMLKLLLDYLVEQGKVDIIKEAVEGRNIFLRHYSVK